MCARSRKRLLQRRLTGAAPPEHVFIAAGSQPLDAAKVQDERHGWSIPDLGIVGDLADFFKTKISAIETCVPGMDRDQQLVDSMMSRMSNELADQPYQLAKDWEETSHVATAVGQAGHFAQQQSLLVPSDNLFSEKSRGRRLPARPLFGRISTRRTAWRHDRLARDRYFGL